MDWLDVGVDVGKQILGQGLAYGRDLESRAWQEEMWNKQNEYNLPFNQRKRLEEAGINPNLAFGSSASTLGTSMPSSPTTHIPQVDLGEFSLRAKQIRAAANAQNAAADREREETERLRLMNEMTSLLFNDTVETRRGQMYIDRIIQGWQEDNIYKFKDLEFTGLELKNDAQAALSALTRMRTDATAVNIQAARQEIDHLKKKYKFEDLYYDQLNNPYETSTPLGFLRAIYGTLIHMVDGISSLF